MPDKKQKRIYLSPVGEQVVRFMQLKKPLFYCPTTGRSEVILSKDGVYSVKSSTFRALANHKIIQHFTGNEYILTDIGKKIDL